MADYEIQDGSKLHLERFGDNEPVEEVGDNEPVAEVGQGRVVVRYNFAHDGTMTRSDWLDIRASATIAEIKQRIAQNWKIPES